MLKDIFKYITVFIAILSLFLIQVYVIDSRTIFGMKPNIILISVVISALWFGIYKSSIYAMLIGIILDSIYSNQFGVFTISYLIVAIVIGSLNQNYTKGNVASIIYLTVLGTILFESIEYLIYIFLSSRSSNLITYIFTLFISCILNSILAVIVYKILNKFNIYLNEK